MNKKLLSLIAGVCFVFSCTYHEQLPEPNPELDAVTRQLKETNAGKVKERPKAKKVIKNNSNKPGTVAYYQDWDSAIRIDVDLHNMYDSTPTKIEKPIDMYMAMALALKYNYSRRLSSYQQLMFDVGNTPYSQFPDLLSRSGYINTNNSSSLNPDLKVAWNVLDVSTVYMQNSNKLFQANVAFEESRKVIHNILQETRSLYWRSLAAQRLIPIIDDMTENLTLEVDEINSRAKEYAAHGKSLSTQELMTKRQYMDAVQKAAELKRQMENSSIELATFMGFHPSTEYHLVGAEYGNFSIPYMKNNLADLEWLALSNRPELKVYDIGQNINELRIQVKDLKDPGMKNYQKNPRYYNDLWSRKAREVTISVFEDLKQPNRKDLNTLRRQRATSIILSQLYVAWAQYMSAVEDYDISMEIANTSENIAEDVTIQDGSYAEKSKLESARAINDEAKAFLAYADVQDALGNLYASIGLDALPYYMLNENVSAIALSLRETLSKWREGEFMPQDRPYLLDIPTKRPPVNMTSNDLVPDMEIRVGERFSVTLPQSIFDRLNLKGRITTKAGLIDDSPLPKWMSYDEDTYTLSGVGMPSNVGAHQIKIYVVDETGKVGYITFQIKLNEYYAPSMEVRGAGKGGKAEVFKPCSGSGCADSYMEETVTELDSF